MPWPKKVKRSDNADQRLDWKEANRIIDAYWLGVVEKMKDNPSAGQFTPRLMTRSATRNRSGRKR